MEKEYYFIAEISNTGDVESYLSKIILNYMVCLEYIFADGISAIAFADEEYADAILQNIRIEYPYRQFWLQKRSRGFIVESKEIKLCKH